MSSLSISLEGVIVLQVLTYLAVVGVFVLRIWILWDVASTRPFLFTTLSHAIFTLCVLASLGFLSAFTTIEYKARREVHTEEEVFERLFTIPISKVGSNPRLALLYAVKFTDVVAHLRLYLGFRCYIPPSSGL